MQGKIRERLTYANVMVTLLAFIVLGGTAWALAKNSVGSKQLKANAVHTADIDDGAVTSDKLAADAVSTEKVKDGTLEKGDFAAGVLSGETTVRSVTETVPMTCSESGVAGSYILFCNGQQTVTAPCEAGEHATGGGAKGSTTGGGGSQASASASENYPAPQSGTPTGWTSKAFATGSNSGSSPGLAHPPDPQVTVYAVCSS